MIAWIILILLLIVAVYLWYNSDAAKRKRIRSAFKGGTREPKQAVEVLNDLRRMSRPRMADYVMVGAVIRDRGHIDRTDAANPLVVGLMQEGLNAEIGDLDDLEIQYLIHQMVDTGWALNAQQVDRVTTIQDDSLTYRLAKAKQETEGRAETTAKFLEDSQHYTSASQSVHDSAVNSDLREILQVMINDCPNMGRIAAIKEARYEVEQIKNPAKKACAHSTLSHIEKNEPCSTFNMQREADIFSLVWSRCDHEANRDVRVLMRNAVVNALVDCVEREYSASEGHPEPVCINGRIAKVVNSLALLDFDPRMKGAMTYEAYRNQVLEETKRIFNNTLDEFENGDDQQRAAAKSFEDGDDEGAKPLLDTLDKKIDENIELYKDKIPHVEFEGLRKECKAYLIL